MSKLLQNIYCHHCGANGGPQLEDAFFIYPCHVCGSEEALGQNYIPPTPLEWAKITCRHIGAIQQATSDLNYKIMKAAASNANRITVLEEEMEE